MIYFGPHVRALEAQIAYLKERVAKLEEEKRELIEGRAAAAEAQARAHIDTLKSDVDDARLRANGLLDRVLAKNNIAPVVEQPKPIAMPDVITPFGVAIGDAQEALKESWLREETQYLMGKDGLDEGTAREVAERNYLAQYQPITSN